MDDDFESLFGSRAPSPVEYSAPRLALPSGPSSGSGLAAGRTHVGTIALHGLPQRSEPPSLSVASTSVISTTETHARGTKRRRAQSSERKVSPHVPLPMNVPDLVRDTPSNLLRNHPNLLGLAGQVSGLRLQSLNPRGTSRNPIRLYTPQPPRNPLPPPPPATGPVQKANPAVQQLLGNAAFVSVLETLLPPTPSSRKPTLTSTSERRPPVPPAATNTGMIRRIPRIGARHTKPTRRSDQRDSQSIVNTTATNSPEPTLSISAELEVEPLMAGSSTLCSGEFVASSSNLPYSSPLAYDPQEESSDSMSITTSTPSLSHSITDSPGKHEISSLLELFGSLDPLPSMPLVSTTIDMFDDFDALLQPVTTTARPQLTSTASAGEGLEFQFIEDSDLSSLLALLGDSVQTKPPEPPRDIDFAALLEHLGVPP